LAVDVPICLPAQRLYARASLRFPRQPSQEARSASMPSVPGTQSRFAHDP
jgi:hypothetical protein